MKIRIGRVLWGLVIALCNCSMFSMVSFIEHSEHLTTLAETINENFRSKSEFRNAFDDLVENYFSQDASVVPIENHHELAALVSTEQIKAYDFLGRSDEFLAHHFTTVPPIKLVLAELLTDFNINRMALVPNSFFNEIPERLSTVRNAYNLIELGSSNRLRLTERFFLFLQMMYTIQKMKHIKDRRVLVASWGMHIDFEYIVYKWLVMCNYAIDRILIQDEPDFLNESSHLSEALDKAPFVAHGQVTTSVITSQEYAQKLKTGWRPHLFCDLEGRNTLGIGTRCVEQEPVELHVIIQDIE